MPVLGRESIAKEFDKGYKFIADTYNSSQGVYSPLTQSIILNRGIVIEASFDLARTGQSAVMRPAYSLNVKLIADDFNQEDPQKTPNKMWYAPFFPIHNLIIPEVGEEVFVIKEGSSYSSRGYWIGRINETPLTNLFLAESWKDDGELNVAEGTGEQNPLTKYGFTFDVNELRNKPPLPSISPAYRVNNYSISATYGDVVQQGRSRTFIRHSFNRDNFTGVLEAGINNDLLTVNDNMVLNNMPLNSSNPSIGETRTKSIHFIDSTVKKIENISFASAKAEETSGLYDGEERSIIFNQADQIYNVSSGNNGMDDTLYSQVLGERLNDFHRQSIGIVKTMLDSLTGLTETMQILLDAFIDHDHALPKIELNLEKTIKSKDRYRTAPRFEMQPPEFINVPARTIRIQTGTDERGRPQFANSTIPGYTQEIPIPPKLVSAGQTRTRNIEQKINFEAIIGGEENPRFTAPVQLVNQSESNTVISAADGNPMNPGTDAKIEPSSSELGKKTNKINDNTIELIDSFNRQKETLQDIFNRVDDYLSENQFIN